MWKNTKNVNTMDLRPNLAREIKKKILSCLDEEEHGRVRISEPTRRQNELRVVVDNFSVMNVTELMKKFPPKTKVYCRAVSRNGNDIVLSRVEIYYFLESGWWRFKWGLLFTTWVIAPIAISVGSVFFFDF